MKNKIKYIKIIIIILLLLLLLLLLLYNKYKQNNKQYYIVQNNFLDKTFIDKIYNTIISEKDWIYTTNNGNDKIKHNNDIKNKKIKAKKMNNNK